MSVHTSNPATQPEVTKQEGNVLAHITEEQEAWSDLARENLVRCGQEWLILSPLLFRLALPCHGLMQLHAYIITAS